MGSIIGHRIEYNGVGAQRCQRHIPNPGRFVSFSVSYFLKSDQDTVKSIPDVFDLEFPHGVVSLRFFQTINSHGRLDTVERSLKLISEVDLAPEITEVGWGRCRKTSVLPNRYTASERQWSKNSYMTALEKEVTKGWPPRLWRRIWNDFSDFRNFRRWEVRRCRPNPVPRLSRVQWRIMYLTWRLTLIKYGGQAERKLFSTLTAF